MFVSIRKYDGCKDVATLNRRVQEVLVSRIKGMKGFRSYAVVDLGGGAVASISAFDTRADAEAANASVRGLVQQSFLDLVPNAPTVMVGEVLSETKA
jgi:hypothetical protein